ncbi:MAG: hypothetical protein E7254_03275 [Lachnospiraceae bacterium]|nr:hypothetical protein [Lachnospiraceae bacterium]
MKRKTYIFCFVALIILFVSAYFAGTKIVKRNQIKYKGTDGEAVTNVGVTVISGYWLRLKDDYVVIYNSKDEYIANTAISTDSLSEEEKLILENGIYVETANELFRYLESYTS